MAAEEGTVEIVYHWNGKRTQGDTNSYGNMVKIRHANWNGGTLHTLYAHLNSINVKQSMTVGCAITTSRIDGGNAAERKRKKNRDSLSSRSSLFFLLII